MSHPASGLERDHARDHEQLGHGHGINGRVLQYLGPYHRPCVNGNLGMTRRRGTIQQVLHRSNLFLRGIDLITEFAEELVPDLLRTRLLVVLHLQQFLARGREVADVTRGLIGLLANHVSTAITPAGSVSCCCLRAELLPVQRSGTFLVGLRWRPGAPWILADSRFPAVRTDRIPIVAMLPAVVSLASCWYDSCALAGVAVRRIHALAIGLSGGPIGRLAVTAGGAMAGAGASLGSLVVLSAGRLLRYVGPREVSPCSIRRSRLAVG